MHSAHPNGAEIAIINESYSNMPFKLKYYNIMFYRNQKLSTPSNVYNW